MALVKPGLVTGTIVTPGIGLAGTVFVIKAMDVDYDFNTRVEEVTGDGDAQPNYEHNELFDGRIAIRGAMVAGTAIGIKNLVASTNPVAIETFDLGGGSPETIKVILIVERIRVRWNRVSAFAGVSLLTKVTGMSQEQVDAIEV